MKFNYLQFVKYLISFWVFDSLFVKEVKPAPLKIKQQMITCMYNNVAYSNQHISYLHVYINT